MRLAAAFGVVILLAMSTAPGADAQSTPDPLTVYSSLPLSGAARPQAQAIVRGARLALEEAGGSAGGRQIRYVSLNDATSRVGSWTPQKTASNARRAASDESTIAYIGEFNSGASAISMPILNEAGIAQISPSNTAIGLTRSGPGAEAGEPEKYLPAGYRHYFRLAPNDRVQGGALAAAMRDRRCRRVALLDDGEIYGRGVTTWTRRHALRIGLEVVARRTIDRNASGYRKLARRLRARRANCVAYGGITANNAVRLFRDLARGLPRARLFGSDGIAESGFSDPHEGGVPAKVGRRVLVTVGTLAPFAYPAQGQDFFRRYSERYGEPNPDPYAIYGYEAMRLVLDAIAAASPSRQAVVERLRDMPARAGALGTYRFDRYGDTTLRSYGVYRIRQGALSWAGAVEAP
jgi:branched-chain amino acid transport system substrate-binding protein